MTATVTAGLEPGSAEWFRFMTASKVAAVLGVSKYESPRSLWHKMRAEVPPEPATKVQSRGHYLEPGVLAWFFDQHPELYPTLSPGTHVHANGWAAATPDATGRDADAQKTYPVEAKTAAEDDEWGERGTDEIPIHYAAQCMWTMHVLGAELIYVPMLTERLEFREYVVHYDAALANDIEEQCKAFLDSLNADIPPAVDSHPETFRTLKRLNPLIEQQARAELTRDQALLFVKARRDQAAADAQSKLANSTVAEVMGTAQYGYHDGQLVARRQNTASGIPALYAAKPLPTIITKADAA
jgi:putative phage-type endonuclease